ncbi:MFS transporter [Nakamurella deserti]|uniref:MFS transporter n=1 Tax=Nakamurella deserti TaxID=2164074 RepID=UPI000DBE8D68|nr:MFS transporter [Nakamurella deserti]
MQASTRLTVALLAGGVATFSELYTTQALLPDLADSWQVGESAAALTVSVATGALALSVLPWAAVADRIGRARAMRLSAVVTAVVGLLLPLAPTFGTLLVLRGISGLALGALPALAIAHVVELDRAGRAAAVGGIYVAGTTIGGLVGRLVSGTVGGTFGWRWGTAATGVVVAVAAIVFVVLLPGSAVRPTARTPGRIRLALRSDRVVWVFYLQGFLLMGGFVTMYNLLAFRLVAPPYLLSPTVVSLLFVAYLVGTVGSSAVGRLVGRWGRHTVLITAGSGMSVGALVTLAGPLWLIVVGLVLVTFGFFVAHALAASWAGERIPQARSQATALYSLGYYAGSSLIGYLGAAVYVRTGWWGAAVLVAALAALAATVAAVGAPRRPAAA